MLGRALAFALLLGTSALALFFLIHPTDMLVLRPTVAAPLELAFSARSLALPFLALIVLVAPAIALWTFARSTVRDALLLAAFVLSMVAVLLSQSVAAFVLSWELMALVSAFLVGTHHERRPVRRALFSYLLISQLGAICIMAALALLAVHAGSTRFDDIARVAGTLPDGLRIAVALFALVGFGSKAGLLPLHFWLPRAHPVAPANASALLSGVMLNIAIYGLLVVSLVLAAPLSAQLGMLMIVVGMASALVGSLYAAIETDLKRLLAFSSIENSGIVVGVLGLAIVANADGLPAVGALALVALFFHAFNHGLFKSLLFLGAGTVAQQAHSTDLDHLGGLARLLSFSAPLMLIGCAAAASLPGLNGFASEWLIFRGFIAAFAGPASLQFAAAASIAVLAASSACAGFAYVKLYGIGFLGVRRSTHAIVPEPPDASTLGLAVLAFACVVLGLVPLLAVRPIAALVASFTGAPAIEVATLPVLPVMLVALPLVGGIFTVAMARIRPTRTAPTWTCGSPVTARYQYTATAFSKPLRLVFAALFSPQRERTIEAASPWIPLHIDYEVSTRYLGDESSRSFAAIVARLARRTRIVQGGRLRVYLAYAFAALAIVLVFAR